MNVLCVWKNMLTPQHKNIRIIKGLSPILVSAPHAVPIKKRTKDRSYTRRREARADELVEKICEKSSSWGIMTQSKGTIQNWRNKGGVYHAYKDTVDHIIQSNNIKLFVDVHGARKTRPFLIDYDLVYPEKHPHDDVLEASILSALSNHFPSHSISNGFFRKLNGPGSKTLTYHVRKNLKTPALQLEINKTLKDHDEALRAVANAIHDLIDEYSTRLRGLEELTPSTTNSSEQLLA